MNKNKIKGDGANFSFRDFEHYFCHWFLLKSQKEYQFSTPQQILCSEMTKMSKIDEILRGKCWKNCRQVKICVQKGELLQPTPLRITIWSDGIIQLPFYCHHLKAECMRSILSFYRLQNTSKTPKLCLFENLHSIVAAGIWFSLGELTLKQAVLVGVKS